MQLKKKISKLVRSLRDERDVEEYSQKIEKICRFYGELFDIDPVEILLGMENNRKISIEGYYTESKFPTNKKHFIVFEDEKDLRKQTRPEMGFRCPHCKGISKHPYICDSGVKLVLMNSNGKKETCNWKSFGLFGTLGKGMWFTLKSVWPSNPVIDESFMPIAMEDNDVRRGYRVKTKKHNVLKK